MSTNVQINVQVQYDPEAMVFIATSEDVYGIAIESHSLDELRERLLSIIPEMVQENGLPGHVVNNEVPVELLIHNREQLALVG